MLFFVGLILVSLLQSTIFPQEWIVLILIARSFVTYDRLNIILAFFLGLLISVLSGQVLGFLSLIYLMDVTIVGVLRKTQIISRWLMLIPVVVVILFINQLFVGINLNSLLINTILIIPVFWGIKVWEERFVGVPEVKLKLGK